MIITFWKWFWRGTSNSKSGIRLLLNWTLVVHFAVAMLLLLLVRSDPFEFAAKALFPAASILVSMAVAWTSRAATILQDTEFRNRAIGENNPLEAYVYGYQLSLLIIISMVVYVAVMAAGGLDLVIFSEDFSLALSGFWLYFLLSWSVAQCWLVIDFSNMLTLLHQRARR